MKYIFYERRLLTSVGGVETACWNLAREFVLQGKEVAIVTGKGDRPCPYPELEPYIRAFDFVPQAKQPKFLGRRLAKTLENLSLAKSAGDFLRDCSRESAVIFFKPNGVFALHRYLRDFKRVCFHSQGVDFCSLDRRLFEKYVTHLSACSHFNAFQNRCHFKRQPVVIPNGVTEAFLAWEMRPENRIRWRELFKTNPQRMVFAFAGRMVEWKGIGIFLEAMKIAGGDEELWLIGEGPALEGWISSARRLGVGNRVKHHGFIKHSQLPSLWDAVDIGVFPSIGDDAFGISIAEAMACGKPVIGSNLGGIPEVVGNEEQCGWLCENLNAIEYAQAIRAARSANLNLMGKNARARASRFQWRAAAKKFADFINSPGNQARC